MESNYRDAPAGHKNVSTSTSTFESTYVQVQIFLAEKY